MFEYKVRIKAPARKKIRERAEYIALESGSKKNGQNYAKGIREFCQSLSTFPHRSIKRADLRPHLRITNYKGTSIIAYRIDDKTKSVHILDVFHSAQNYEELLNPDEA